MTRLAVVLLPRETLAIYVRTLRNLNDEFRWGSENMFFSLFYGCNVCGIIHQDVNEKKKKMLCTIAGECG
jgi:hypothetical protein